MEEISSMIWAVRVARRQTVAALKQVQQQGTSISIDVYLRTIALYLAALEVSTVAELQAIEAQAVDLLALSRDSGGDRGRSHPPF